MVRTIAMTLAIGLASAAGAAAALQPEGEPGILALLARYEEAIESKDIDRFRVVMPNLSSDDQERLERSFHSIRVHQVEISVVSMDVQGARARVRIRRRDTLNPGTAGEMVSAFMQTLELAAEGDSWHIERIAK